ncbi:amidohydrolase [Alkalihalobacillus oceani]|uniref:Amidohydrolase n=1 Tax=Halalkalibacter oceani TaxID=1653776 RepID=A0A9X2DQ45_9BACI|nr:amidohydrolase [Halalkalibacter oceani]MCM3715016.1 amidohydrolase [Halalkalibacter oceani]
MGTLWHNGTFFTMSQEGEVAEAVYVENGLIQAVGETEKLERQYKDRMTSRRDVGGAFVYPGFVDSHLHLIGHGEKLLRLDLSEVASAAEMKQLLRKKVLENKEDEWLFAEGWNENNFSDRKIFHRSELDEIAPDQPMYLSRICRHAALVNSEALKRAGISSATPDPPGGVIVRDHQGEPTGYLLDTATELIKQVIPPVSEEYIRRALMTAVDDVVKLGLVGGHTEDLFYYGGFLRTFKQFQEVIDGKRRKFRAHLLIHHEALAEMEAAGVKEREISPFLELGAVKIFVDGALGGRTALLRDPYTDDPSTSGVAIHTEEELLKLVKLARAKGRPVALHTIGDQALALSLAAIQSYPLADGEGRDRLIHVQVVNDELVEQMTKLPVVLDIQPRFVVSDFPWVMERLGYDRLPHSFAWKSLLARGLHCAGGSDAPIEPVDPLLGIHAAVTRRKAGETHEGYLPEQKLSVFEAVTLFTRGSAYASNKEKERGQIAPRFTADFTVLDTNLFTCEPDQIVKANVMMTVVDNTVVYTRGGDNDAKS